MEPNVELAKTRDFGEIISDTILFARQNIKPLLSCFFTFCGFFLLAAAVATILQQIKIVDLFNNTDAADRSQNPFNYLREVGIETLLSILFMLLTYTAMPVTILSFIALYKEKGNIAPTNQEVWGYFKYYFFKILGSSFLNFIILMAGFVFCLIPGIYLYPILGLIFPIMMVENTTYGYAFNQSFRLIKENWWLVFGTLFIMGLIVSICSAAVTIPFTVANMGTMFLHPTKGMHMSLASIVIATILKQLAHVLYILPIIALALCYFSLTEGKDATGLMDRINQLGNNNTDNTGLPEEQY